MVDFRKATALYGGAFDPIHLGHMHVAQEVKKAVKEIEELVFVPANISPGKPKLAASPEQRLEFLKISLSGTSFKTWDFEIKRPGESFTIDTLEEAHRLGATKEKLYWVLGADAYLGFKTWKKSERIRSLCRLIVVGRPGTEIVSQNGEDLVIKIPLHPLSATLVRDHLAQGKIPENALPPPLERHLRDLLLKSQNPYAMH